MTSQVEQHSIKSVSDILEKSALPDAPLAMPVQVLERERSFVMPWFNWFGFAGRSRANN